MLEKELRESIQAVRARRPQRLPKITVHDGKGQKSRRTMLPGRINTPLQEHLRRVRLLHQTDVKKGYGQVVLPHALARKYPHAETSWEWQYVFPAKTMSREQETGVMRRHHVPSLELPYSKEELFTPGSTAGRRPALRCLPSARSRRRCRWSCSG